MNCSIFKIGRERMAYLTYALLSIMAIEIAVQLYILTSHKKSFLRIFLREQDNKDGSL